MSSNRKLIWKAQRQFLQTASLQASDLFNLLDENLRPNIFLVGVNSEIGEDNTIQSESVWVESDSQTTSNYREALALGLNINLKRAFKEHPLGNSFENETDPNVANTFFNRIFPESWRVAVESVIREVDETQRVVSFCSMPQDVGDHLISVVLQFNSEVYKSYSPLNTYKIRHGLVSLPTSLVEAVARLYLKECERDLASRTPGGGLLVVDRMNEEMIRDAGYRFMLYSAAKSNVEGPLFHVCNKVSSNRYETRECKGKIIVARKDHPDIRVCMTFEIPIKLTSFRQIRKLLEISDKNTALLANGEEIYGIGEKMESYEEHEENQDLFEVIFNGHYKWSLKHGRTILMEVNYGLPVLYKPPIEIGTFTQEIRKVFPDIIDKQIEGLWPLIEAAKDQEHGTTLVIVRNAADEAERLKKQATKVEPVQLSAEMTRRVSAIDGAVIIDLDANCYAIGVILDGQHSDRADSSRGARYNSAIRYVDSEECRFAVVVSVDGGIEFINRVQASTIDNH